MEWFVVGALALTVLFYLVAIYNRLVALRNQYQNGFAQIEVQLKRRYDLIPNLVETAKGYLKHEAQTLEAVIQARNAARKSLDQAHQNPTHTSIDALNKAEGSLVQALGGLNVVMEAYPELKANENMIKLHEDLTSTENKIAFARQAYNDFVTAYNTYRQSFPHVLVANNTGHTMDALLLEFADTPSIQEPIKVHF